MLFIFFLIELQRERRRENCPLHDKHGNHQVHVHKMSNCEEDSQHSDGEV